MAQRKQSVGVAYGMSKVEKAKNLKSGHRAVYKAALDAFSQKLAEVRAERTGSVQSVRKVCKRAKKLQATSAKRARERAREELNEKIRTARQKLKADCACRIKRIRDKAAGKSGTVRAEAAERRRIEQETQSAEQRIRAEHAKRKRAGEALRESADAVRAELPDDLVPVFNRVGHKVKARGKQSRAEAFLHWAHENAGEVVEIQSRYADRLAKADIAALQKQEREMTKRVRSTRGAPKYSDAEMKGLRRLGIDPFAPAMTASGDVPF